MKALTVIPARFGASRLPGKPLSDIHQKPMIQWVYEGARGAKGTFATLIATDDERIQKAALAFGAQVRMTSADLASGTDRVAAVAQEVFADIYINVQGDEPLIRADLIEAALELVSSGRFPMATLMTRLDFKDRDQPSVVKVWTDSQGRAVKFSRTISESPDKAFRHIGIYVYTRETLQKLTRLAQTESEKKERLEQLRAMDHGIPIGVAEVSYQCVGVDTPEDLDQVREMIRLKMQQDPDPRRKSDG